MGKHNSKFLNYLCCTLGLHFLFCTTKVISERSFTPLATLRMHISDVGSFDTSCGNIEAFES